MPFRARNLFYLRISATTVIPLYLYLDERHIDWMTDRALQHVLSDLRPLIIPKLKADAVLQASADKNKGTVDVHRGDFYQFAFFFRNAEPHNVIIKTRNFTLAPPPPKPSLPRPQARPDPPRKRKSKKSAAPTTSKKQKIRGKRKTQPNNDEDDIEMISSDSEVEAVDRPTTGPRRSGRARRQVTVNYREEDEITSPEGADIDMTGPASEAEPHIKEEEEDPSFDDPDPDGEPRTNSLAPSMELELEEDEEEIKPKPLLQLKYQGFNIHGRCLCVIIEPWPPIRSASRAPSLVPTGLRRPSIAPPDFVLSGGPAQRERTPLFLPDDDERARSETPAPFFQGKFRPPVPLFNEASADADMDADQEEDGLMQFSQMLRSTGDFGGAEADDEMEGAVFFGDADENKEL